MKNIEELKLLILPDTDGQISIGWFPAGPGGDYLDEKIFKGPLARMAHEALDHIKRNFLREMVIKFPDRAESRRVSNFPYPAVEEALMNALYHRSYQEPDPVEVRISPDELVVLSFPGPDRSISLENLRNGRAVSRRYRNRRIGDFLKELDLTEGRSTGVPKILKVMEQNGSPPPIFETDDERIAFVIRLPVQPVFLHAQTDTVRYKVFLNKKQQGPYTLAEMAQLIARGEVQAQTKVWLMSFNPLKDKWQTALSRADLAGMFDQAAPDSAVEDAIPDPE
jgi:predicted HTH transcriptional regulator